MIDVINIKVADDPEELYEVVSPVSEDIKVAKEPYVEVEYGMYGSPSYAHFYGHDILSPHYSTVEKVEMTNVRMLKNYVFSENEILEEVIFSDNLEEIGNNSFYGCSRLTSLDFPASLKTIGITAFEGCLVLSEVTFHGKVDSIGRNAFNNCNNLRTIRVPWSEGEVPDAPWGAINATIQYNCED